MNPIRKEVFSNEIWILIDEITDAESRFIDNVVIAIPILQINQLPVKYFYYFLKFLKKLTTLRYVKFLKKFFLHYGLIEFIMKMYYCF